MPDQEAIAQHQEQLAIYRRTLAHLLRQAAQYGGEINAPTHVANGIHEARQEIQRIKGILRANGFSINDQPGDDPLLARVAALQKGRRSMILIGFVLISTTLIAILLYIFLQARTIAPESNARISVECTTKFGQCHIKNDSPVSATDMKVSITGELGLEIVNIGMDDVKITTNIRDTGGLGAVIYVVSIAELYPGQEVLLHIFVSSTQAGGPQIPGKFGSVKITCKNCGKESEW